MCIRDRVADFGVARTERALATSLTTSASPPGTPIFMAPEQMLGEPGDARSDLYAVGVVFHRLVAGTYYFGAAPLNYMELRQRILSEPPRLDAPGLDPPLRAWLARALAKAPAERFASASEMRDALLAAAP